MGFLDKFVKTEPTVVGIDIGSHAVKVVEVSRKGGRATVANYGIGPLPLDAIVDGEVMDSEVVVQCIQDLLDERGIRTRNVASAVSGRSVIVKRITMDSMSEEEANEAIYWEAEQHVPYGIDEISLDYEVLGEAEEGRMEVLLVAAKRETVEMHTAMLRDAGLVPYVVDVDSFAVQNSFEANYDVEEGEKVLLLNVGASVTNVNLLCDGAPLLTRDLSIAGAAFAEEVQRTLEVDREEALRIIESGDEDAREKIAPILETVGQDLLLGIERSLSYLKGSAGSADVSRAILSGGGSLLDGLQNYLSSRLGIPVDVADPFKQLSYNPSLFGEDELDRVGPSLMVAVGLALR